MLTRCSFAGFRADDTVAFADVMLPTKRTGQATWRMVEVKSSTNIKDYHREDAAIQAYVAKSAGVPLASISIYLWFTFIHSADAICDNIDFSGDMSNINGIVSYGAISPSGMHSIDFVS
jgi:hypothetical protein